MSVCTSVSDHLDRAYSPMIWLMIVKVAVLYGCRNLGFVFSLHNCFGELQPCMLYLDYCLLDLPVLEQVAAQKVGKTDRIVCYRFSHD